MAAVGTVSGAETRSNKWFRQVFLMHQNSCRPEASVQGQKRDRADISIKEQSKVAPVEQFIFQQCISAIQPQSSACMELLNRTIWSQIWSLSKSTVVTHLQCGTIVCGLRIALFSQNSKVIGCDIMLWVFSLAQTGQLVKNNGWWKNTRNTQRNF